METLSNSSAKDFRQRKRLALSFLKPPFRGGCIENLANAPMGKGHNNDGKPFDLESACYLKPVFAAYDEAVRRGWRRKFVVKAGVKTMKSFSLEICAADHCCHRNGDTAIYFGSGDVAEDQSSTRILDFFRGIPAFREKVATMRSRFDATIGAMKFPDKTLRILPANLANTQGLNLGFAGLCDAFVTETNGMIDQMIARTTQYQDAIVFLESQGGEAGFDFDRHYEDTDQRELHVICPYCDSSHIFNWKAFDLVRDEKFVAVLPKRNALSAERGTRDSEIEQEAAEGAEEKINELSKVLRSEARRRCGFMRGEDDKIKNADGSYNEAAILKEAHFECYHCGSRWEDTPEMREFLDRSSHYVAARTNALVENVGFNVPQWINRRLAWGPIVLDKLKAQRDADTRGNYGPLMVWWQKRAARTWDKDMTAKAPEKIAASLYDGKEQLPGELVRISGTDCQLNLTHMIYQAWAIGDGVPPRLLHYEWVKPPAGLDTDHAKREWCKNRVRALDKEFGIEQQNSMKDCAHRPDLVREWAAEDAVFSKIKSGVRIQSKWITYGLLIGDEKVSFRWHHPGRAATWERFKQKETVLVDVIKEGRSIRIPVQHRLWSNPSIKDIACRWRDGDGAPRIQVHEQFLVDTSKEGFWAQMCSERKLPWKGHPGKERYDNENKPNHAWDGFNMVMVRMDELGYLNHFGAPGEDEKD